MKCDVHWLQVESGNGAAPSSLPHGSSCTRSLAIDAILVLIFEFLPDLVLTVLCELPILFGLERASSKSKKRRRNPIAAQTMFGCLLVGGVLGAAAVLIFPKLTLQMNPFGLLTLISNPILAGLAMKYYGKLRRNYGQTVMPLATFHGGATLVLGACLARLVAGLV
jgi:hypothetical protein